MLAFRNRDPHRIGPLAALVLASVLTLGAAVSAGAEESPKVAVGETRVVQSTKSEAPKATGASADSGMTLRGGQDRTDFRTMTVEGEDRVHLDVERPPLLLELDPEKVSGLESGTAADVLNRVPPDLMTSYLGVSAHQTTPYLGRPWLRQFATGAVAVFHPAVKGVERWKLVVADSKGQTVATFQGQGDPPKTISWDGRSQSGAPVTPGLTYSHYFEAYDRAGNKRNFVGEGFRVSAYRLETPMGPVLVFSGQSLLAANGVGRSASLGGSPGQRATPPVVLELASWLNQSPRISQPVRVTATARSYEQANLLAKQVSASLAQLTLGDPARVQGVAEVVADAPDGGMIRVGVTGGPESVSPQPFPTSATTKEKAPKGKEDESKKGKK